MNCCCHQKTKHRSPEEQKSLVNRLSRIEGQVRGLRDMLQRDAYCPDILVQVSAVNAAMKQMNCPRRDGRASAEFLTYLYSGSADALKQGK